MKILFISPTFSGAGGIGPHASRLAQKLGQEGHDVELMDVPHIPIKNLKNPSFSIFGTFKALANSKTYDVVHAWNVPSAFIMKHIKAKKKILSVHGVYSQQVKMLHSKLTSSIISSKERQVLDYADVLTTDSKAVSKAYKKKLGVDFEFLFSPLDITKFNDLPDVSKKEKQVIYIGRDSYEKGIDILRDIESKINGNIVYCTDLTWKEAMSELKASSILVVPSRMESIPQVIKEAFFLNVPVVATKVGGIPELIEHEKNGLIVNPNDPDQLLNSVNELLENNDKATSIAHAGHDFVVKNLTWEILLPKYIKFYENLLNS